METSADLDYIRQLILTASLVPGLLILTASLVPGLFVLTASLVPRLLMLTANLVPSIHSSPCSWAAHTRLAYGFLQLMQALYALIANSS